MAAIPQKLKTIGHYINIANEHANRDPVIYYWCLFYAVQTGMAIDKSSPDCIQYLTALLNTLEQVKKQLAGNEAISQDIVAQAHIEQVALKLFAHADNEDRAAHHGKNLVKTFYTAGHLMDVLTLFGELDEQLMSNRKYAKWKATYIHNCLKNGETPVPGPPGGLQDGDDDDTHRTQLGFDHLNVDDDNDDNRHEGGTTSLPPAAASSSSAGTLPTAASAPSMVQPSTTTASTSLSAERLAQAQKYAKYAVSALSYEDTASAIDNLQQALRVLTGGN